MLPSLLPCGPAFARKGHTARSCLPAVAALLGAPLPRSSWGKLLAVCACPLQAAGAVARAGLSWETDPASSPDGAQLRLNAHAVQSALHQARANCLLPRPGRQMLGWVFSV